MVVLAIPEYYYEYKAHQCKKIIPPYYSLNKVYNAVDVNADLIVLGNSRAQGHYDEQIISADLGIKCLNLGWSGYPFDYQYYIIYKAYMRQNAKPRYIITDISPYAFFNYISPNYVLELLPYITKPEFKFYEDLCDEISVSDQFLLVRYAGMFDKVIKEIGKLREEEEKSETATGSILPFHDLEELTKAEHLDINPKILNTFIKYIDECLANDIKMIFVCSPMHINICREKLPLQEFWQLINGIVADKDITILDYSDLFDSDTTYFSDPFHLNPMGKSLFSQKLSHDLDSMQIITKDKKDC